MRYKYDAFIKTFSKECVFHQPAIKCSKLIIKTLEQVVKMFKVYVFKVNFKHFPPLFWFFCCYFSAGKCRVG